MHFLLLQLHLQLSLLHGLLLGLSPCLVLLIDDWEQGEVSIQWTVWDEEGDEIDDFDSTIDEDGYLNLDSGELEEDYDYANTWISVNIDSYSSMQSYSSMYVYWIPY